MYLFFDTETNGLPLNPTLSHIHIDNYPRLVSIAWILCDDNRKIHEIEKYIVRPNGWVIPKAAVDVHGISTEKAMAEGIDVKIILTKFMVALEKADFVVGHNIRFDRRVMAAELYRNFYGKHWDEYLYNVRYRDTMHISREFCKVPYQPNKKGVTKKGFKMPTLNEMHQVLYAEDVENAHDATADIKATIKCFWRLFDLGLVDRFYLTHKDQSEKL